MMLKRHTALVCSKTTNFSFNNEKNSLIKFDEFETGLPMTMTVDVDTTWQRIRRDEPQEFTVVVFTALPCTFNKVSRNHNSFSDLLHDRGRWKL